MAFTHGKKAVLKLDTVGDVLTDITQYLERIEFTQEAPMSDVTGLGSTYADFVPGVVTARFDLTGKLDGPILAQVEALLALKTFTPSFEYAPQGQVAGRPQLIGTCRVGRVTITTELSDAGLFAFDLWIAGGVVTVATY